jgi:AcrR family transcriptional regulator
MTNGAFYAHFASKEDLVGTAVADQLHHQAASFRERITTRAELAQFVRDYLSTEHRDHRGDGCATAALLAEIGRCDAATRRTYTDALLVVVDNASALIGWLGERDRQWRARDQHHGAGPVSRVRHRAAYQPAARGAGARRVPCGTPRLRRRR